VARAQMLTAWDKEDIASERVLSITRSTHTVNCGIVTPLRHFVTSHRVKAVVRNGIYTSYGGRLPIQ